MPESHIADLLAIATVQAYRLPSPSFARHLPVTEDNETLPPDIRSAHVSFPPHRMDCAALDRADVPRTADPGCFCLAWIDARMSRALITAGELEDVIAS